MFGTYLGVPIHQDRNCVTRERTFPESRNRSRRIHKKLCRRHGGEFVTKPAAFKTPAGIVCHPDIYASLVVEMERLKA